MRKVPDPIRSLIPQHGLPVFALIWTTTPWTLPVNQAVCFNPDLSYSLVSIAGHSGEVYIIASELVEMLRQKLCRQIDVITTFPGIAGLNILPVKLKVTLCFGPEVDWPDRFVIYLDLSA